MKNYHSSERRAFESVGDIKTIHLFQYRLLIDRLENNNETLFGRVCLLIAYTQREGSYITGNHTSKSPYFCQIFETAELSLLYLTTLQ